MRISLELYPTEGDRLHGRVITEDDDIPVSFSGTLDLLRVIEEVRGANRSAVGVIARRTTSVTAPRP